MKQKTHIAFSAFACGSFLSALISSSFHGNFVVSCGILAILLAETIYFIKVYSDE